MDEVLSGKTTRARVREILPPPAATTHPVDVGLRSEAAIISELLRRGYDVLEPRGFNHRYDLVIDTGDRFLRVQCKTGRLRNGVVIYSAQSVRANTRNVVCRGYVDEIDAFLVYCPDLDAVYAIPIEDSANTTGRLRLEPTANNQSKHVRWARDYLLPDPIELRGDLTAA